MLRGLHNDADKAFVDWFAIERSQNRETDVGMYRHYLDPTEPFVNAVIKPAHGAVITSATLRDSLGLSTPANDENHSALADWTSAEARTGTSHLLAPALHAAMASPFDYAGATKVLIVRDIKRDDADQVASAYRELFLAAGGGALGLFTAIGRLRATYQRIAPALEEIAGAMGEKVKIVKLNVDENPETAQKYGIMSIPTLLMFKNGEIAKRQVGAQPKQKLEQWITT